MKIPLYFLLLFLLNINNINSAEINTGKVANYGGTVTKISDEFGKTDWPSQESHLRLICDIDGDGNADIVGFTSTEVIVAFGNGVSFDSSIQISTDFSTGYDTYDRNPRFCADMDGDGKDDIIGFKDDGANIALSTGRTNLETPVVVIQDFCPNRSWISMNTFPKIIKDVDNDGRADIVGFGSAKIYLSYSKEKTVDGKPQIENMKGSDIIFARSISGGAWGDWEEKPRFIGNFYSHNSPTIIGFKDDNIYKSSFVDRTEEFENPAYTSQTTNNNYYETYYPTQDSHPRLIGDIDGDGIDDVIGLHPDQIEFSSVIEGVLQPAQKYSIPGIFVRDTGYTSHKEDPRYLSDINKDGKQDIVAFGDDGVYVMLTQYGCIHSSRDSSQSCKCKDGFREDPLSPNGACLPCVYPCKRCENSDSNCLECVNINSDISFRNPVNDCNCKNGYYKNLSEECVQCDQGCELCVNNSNQCSSCINGYFHTSPANTCTKCNDECTQCIDSADNCTQCRSDSLSLRKTTPSDCMCIDSYYQDSSFQCIKCKNKYAKCSDETIVIECQGLNRENEGLDCVCQTKHFEIIADNQTNCTRCNDECAECQNSPSQCTSCIAGANRKPAPSDCTCLDSYYENSSNQCVKCKNKYAKCSDETTGVQCQGLNRENEGLNCVCKEGFFEILANNQLDCERCSNLCRSCNQFGCIECADNDPNRDQTTCECKTGYYADGSSCKKCNRNCASCNNALTCTQECNSSCALCDQTTQCTSCPVNKFINSQGVCTTCHPKCYTCSDFQTCITCSIKKGTGRSQTGDCSCKQGYYENGNNLDCLQCPKGCKKCDNTGECQICQNEDLIPPLCQQSKIGIILIEQDLGSNQNSSAQCDVKCNRCENNSSNCTECTPGLFRSLELPCLCLEGYHDNDSTTKNCEKCPPFCQKCLNKSKCLQCDDIDNMVLNNITGQCECKRGFQLDKNGFCSQCYSYNQNCFSQCPKNTIQNEDLSICDQTRFLAKDQHTLIWITGVSLLVMIIITVFSLCFSFRKAPLRQKNQLKV